MADETNAGAVTLDGLSKRYGDRTLWNDVSLEIARGERVGIYLEKRFETVVASFGAPAAGAPRRERARMRASTSSTASRTSGDSRYARRRRSSVAGSVEKTSGPSRSENSRSGTPWWTGAAGPRRPRSPGAPPPADRLRAGPSRGSGRPW